MRLLAVFPAPGTKGYANHRGNYEVVKAWWVGRLGNGLFPVSG